MKDTNCLKGDSIRTGRFEFEDFKLIWQQGNRISRHDCWAILICDRRFSQG